MPFIGVTHPDGSVSEIVALPAPVGVNEKVLACVPPARLTEAGTVPTCPLLYLSAMFSEVKSPESGWKFCNVFDASVEAVRTDRVKGPPVRLTFSGYGLYTFGNTPAATTIPDGAKVTVSVPDVQPVAEAVYCAVPEFVSA